MALNLHLSNYMVLLALPIALGESSPLTRNTTKKDKSQSVSHDKTGNIIVIVVLVLVIIVIAINILIAHKLRRREQQEQLAATESSTTLALQAWEGPAWTPPQPPGNVTTITATRSPN